MQQILDNLPQQASSSGSSPIRIPIFYFLLRGTGGSTIHGQYDIEESINIVNYHFDGHFEFYVCGKDEIYDDSYAEMDLDSPSTDFADLVVTFSLTVTNGGGRYPFNPCNWDNDKRSVLPELNFSNPLNGVNTYDPGVMRWQYGTISDAWSSQECVITRNWTVSCLTLRSCPVFLLH